MQGVGGYTARVTGFYRMEAVWSRLQRESYREQYDVGEDKDGGTTLLDLAYYSYTATTYIYTMYTTTGIRFYILEDDLWQCKSSVHHFCYALLSVKSCITIKSPD